MSGLAVWHLFLIVFYGGAIVASARAWAGVWRGRLSYSELRDVTGIGDRAALRRLFGLAGADGRYKVRYADVVRRRRKAGMILTNLPVHGMFLVALGWSATATADASASAIALAASVHALALAAAALSVLVSSREALID